MSEDQLEQLFTIPYIIVLVVWLAAFVLLAIGTIFWVWMVIDLLTRKFFDQQKKIVWLVVLLFAGIPGAIIYYFVARNQGDSFNIGYDSRYRHKQ